MARRELKAARREGKDEGVIKEVARKFHQLIRLHSKAKREQMRARLNLEARKARMCQMLLEVCGHSPGRQGRVP